MFDFQQPKKTQQTTVSVQTDYSIRTNRSPRRPFGGTSNRFRKAKKPAMAVIDVSKDNLVEANELQTAAKGYAQKVAIKNNKEKVYYGLWRKAFETAMKVIADKKGPMIRVTHIPENKKDKISSKTKSDTKKKLAISSDGLENIVKDKESGDERKEPPIPDVAVKVVQKGGKDVVKLRKDTNSGVKNKSSIIKLGAAITSAMLSAKNSNATEAIDPITRGTGMDYNNDSLKQIVENPKEPSSIPGVQVVRKGGKEVLTFRKSTDNDDASRNITNIYSEVQHTATQVKAKDKTVKESDFSKNATEPNANSDKNRDASFKPTINGPKESSSIPGVQVIQKGSKEVLKLSKNTDNGDGSTNITNIYTNIIASTTKVKATEKSSETVEGNKKEKPDTSSNDSLKQIVENPKEPSSIPGVQVVRKGGKEVLTFRKNTDNDDASRNITNIYSEVQHTATQVKAKDKTVKKSDFSKNATEPNANSDKNRDALLKETVNVPKEASAIPGVQVIQKGRKEVLKFSKNTDHGDDSTNITNLYAKMITATPQDKATGNRIEAPDVIKKLKDPKEKPEASSDMSNKSGVHGPKEPSSIPGVQVLRKNGKEVLTFRKNTDNVDDIKNITTMYTKVIETVTQDKSIARTDKGSDLSKKAHGPKEVSENKEDLPKLNVQGPKEPSSIPGVKVLRKGRKEVLTFRKNTDDDEGSKTITNIYTKALETTIRDKKDKDPDPARKADDLKAMSDNSHEDLPKLNVQGPKEPSSIPGVKVLRKGRKEVLTFRKNTDDDEGSKTITNIYTKALETTIRDKKDKDPDPARKADDLKAMSDNSHEDLPKLNVQGPKEPSSIPGVKVLRKGRKEVLTFRKNTDDDEGSKTITNIYTKALETTIRDKKDKDPDPARKADDLKAMSDNSHAHSTGQQFNASNFKTTIPGIQVARKGGKEVLSFRKITNKNDSNDNITTIYTKVISETAQKIKTDQNARQADSTRKVKDLKATPPSNTSDKFMKINRSKVKGTQSDTLRHKRDKGPGPTKKMNNPKTKTDVHTDGSENTRDTQAIHDETHTMSIPIVPVEIIKKGGKEVLKLRKLSENTAINKDFTQKAS